MSYREFKMEMLEELLACKDDPVYFINNYIKVGGETITLHANQLERLEHSTKNNVTELGTDRASGRTTLGLALAVWRFVFNPLQASLILNHSAHSLASSRATIQDMINSLPDWMRPVLKENNRYRLCGENQSYIIFSIASSNAGRGMAIAYAFMDNVGLYKADGKEFLTCVAPCLASTGGKIIVAD